uniref:PH domain-containing protein n=1 Tax=Haptolina brevifila TaxID=156173 RepID=A0A7S2D197_9EUKA|mmetsp:Transcript_31586/g.63105  ORF Transcript_31586/g.63105 Transcript_31586/m.63105 type:complete len:719 (+) Transcript_31586:1-2157(+)
MGITHTASSEKAAANGALPALHRWTPCHCALHSDRRLTIREPNLCLDVAFDLRSAFNVQVVTLEKTAASELSCLQLRMGDGILEFRAPLSELDGGAVLIRWRQTLEEMLMLSMAPTLRGWLYDVSQLQYEAAVALTHCPRVYFDLNSRSQLRTLTETRGPSCSHIGVIELSDLHGIELLYLPEEKEHGKLAGPTQVLKITDMEQTRLLACDSSEDAVVWAKELQTAHRSALITLVQYTGLILIDGWLEYQGDEDEWASGFFVLTIGNGLQCFDEVVNDPSRAMPIESIPISQVTGAVRSKGIDYYDWCIDVRTDNNDYIRVRPPRQAEMTRWLATINLYCTPPPKPRPERPRRCNAESETAAARARALHKSASSGNFRPPPAEQLFDGSLLPATRPHPPRKDSRESLGDMRRAELAAYRSPLLLQAARDHAGAFARDDYLFPPSTVRHFASWSPATSQLPQNWLQSELSSGAVELVQQKRRSLSFSRRGKNTAASLFAPSSAEPKAAPTPRGGRLTSAKSVPAPKPSAASLFSAPEALAPAPAPEASRMVLRRPSFSRNKGRGIPALATADSTSVSVQSSASSQQGQITAAKTLSPKSESSESVGRPQPFRAVRALSFTRRPRKNESPQITRGSSMPGPMPEQADAPLYVVPPGSTKSECGSATETHTSSSSSSEYTASNPVSLTGSRVVSRQNSFGRRMVRRAASFTSRAVRVPRDD